MGQFKAISFFKFKPCDGFRLVLPSLNAQPLDARGTVVSYPITRERTFLNKVK